MRPTTLQPRRRWLSTLALAGLASAFALACNARADDKSAAKAADMKPFTETIPGTEVKFKMVPIPGGTFKMGSPESEKKRGKDEGPQVEVKVDPFYMEEHEVTWAEYEAFLGNYQRLAGAALVNIPDDKRADAVTYPTPLYELEAGPILDRMGRGGNYPAVIMSQHAAKQYCKWLSKRTGRFYRLPTEAEWEYAARAGTTTAYSFGDDPKKIEEYAWDFDNSALQDGDGAYRKVMEKKPNAWGLFDMHGNVAEWCLDQYQEDWYKQLAAKGGVVSVKDALRWPDGKTAHPRVIRGGGWQSEAEECRSAARKPSNKNMNVKDPQLPQSPYWLTEGFWIGFRVVSPVEQPGEAEKLKYWEPDNEATRSTTNRDRDRHEIVTPAPSPQAQATPGK